MSDHPVQLGLFNQKRLADRTVDELIGLAKGITADGIVNTAEANFLIEWMEAHVINLNKMPFLQLYDEIKDMLRDGILDDEEKVHLLELLKRFSGEFSMPGSGQIITPKFPLDEPQPTIKVDGNLFCFTGKFSYGGRKECEKIVSDMGGKTNNKLTLETDYLVIGDLCSEHWIHSAYGRKIERGVELREEYGKLKIISEKNWQAQLIRKQKDNINDKKSEKPQKPERKTRLCIPGRLVRIIKGNDKVDRGELEYYLEPLIPRLIEKGWCIGVRNSYVELTGYRTEIKKYIPVQQRIEDEKYETFIDNERVLKTKVWLPRNEIIVSLGKIHLQDINGSLSENKWEIKTLWTGPRNIFEDFESAWKVFLEIENRYDPGLLLWSKIENYVYYEKY